MRAASSFDGGVSIVVPVFNSADIVDALATRIAHALGDSTYEIIMVDDGSSDDSWARIEELVAGSEAISAIGLMRNYGQHNALLAGIRAASYETVVTIDDDLQHPPEEIPRLLAKLTEGYDVVYGKPRVPHHGTRRNASAALTKFALRVAMGRIAYDVSAFRAFRTDLRSAFRAVEGPYVSIDLLLSWGARRFGTVSVEHHERVSGRSSYGFRRLASHALTMLTGFSTTPLRVASLLGLATTMLGLVLLSFVVIRYLVDGSPVPGFSFLASMIAIFSGVQLLTLGVMGEYVARIHERNLNRPAYVLRERLGGAMTKAGEIDDR